MHPSINVTVRKENESGTLGASRGEELAYWPSVGFLVPDAEAAVYECLFTSFHVFEQRRFVSLEYGRQDAVGADGERPGNANIGRGGLKSKKKNIRFIKDDGNSGAKSDMSGSKDVYLALLHVHCLALLATRNLI